MEMKWVKMIETIRRNIIIAIARNCICGGAGWVWRHELPDTSDWDGSADDTKYSCPYCAKRELEMENE